MKSFKHIWVFFTVLFVGLLFFTEVANAEDGQYVYATVIKHLEKNKHYCKIDVHLWWKDTPTLNTSFGLPAKESNFHNIIGEGLLSNTTWSISKTEGSNNKWLINAPGFKNEIVVGELTQAEKQHSYYSEANASLRTYKTYLNKGYIEVTAKAYHAATAKLDESEYPDTYDTAGLKGDSCSIS